jgi:hypothetical protein
VYTSTRYQLCWLQLMPLLLTLSVVQMLATIDAYAGYLRRCISWCGCY